MGQRGRPRRASSCPSTTGSNTALHKPAALRSPSAAVPKSAVSATGKTVLHTYVNSRCKTPSERCGAVHRRPAATLVRHMTNHCIMISTPVLFHLTIPMGRTCCKLRAATTFHPLVTMSTKPILWHRDEDARLTFVPGKHPPSDGTLGNTRGGRTTTGPCPHQLITLCAISLPPRGHGFVECPLKGWRVVVDYRWRQGFITSRWCARI